MCVWNWNGVRERSRRPAVDPLAAGTGNEQKANELTGVGLHTLTYIISKFVCANWLIVKFNLFIWVKSKCRRCVFCMNDESIGNFELLLVFLRLTISAVQELRCALADSCIYFYCAGSKHATVGVYSWIGCVRFGCDRFLNSIKFRTITCTERNQNNPA